jgi:hypothetical protein
VSATAAKSLQQVKCIFGLAKQRGLDDADLHALVEDATGQPSIRALSYVQADRVIERLGGEPFAARRTVQHRRQKAGVPQIAQPSHLQLMYDLASRRNMSDEGLAQLAGRMRVPFPPRTTGGTNKIVEALKAMNRRAA